MPNEVSKGHMARGWFSPQADKLNSIIASLIDDISHSTNKNFTDEINLLIEEYFLTIQSQSSIFDPCVQKASNLVKLILQKNVSTELPDTPRAQEADSNIYEALRLLSTLRRTEIPLSDSKDIILLLLTWLSTPHCHEKTALVILKIFVDWHKSIFSKITDSTAPLEGGAVSSTAPFKLIPLITPFLDFVKNLFSWINTATRSSSSPSSFSVPENASKSLRVAAECPLIIVVLFQVHKKPMADLFVSDSLLPQFVECAKTFLEEDKESSFLPNELLGVYVKILSLLTFMARAIPISMKIFVAFFPSLILKLGSMINDEISGMRREVLIALRHLMLTPDVRPYISSRLDEFLGNEKFFGCISTLGPLRPIAITTQADFVVQFRGDLSTSMIIDDIIPRFTALLETSESRRLPFAVRTVCIRLLSTLAEHLIVGIAQQTTSSGSQNITPIMRRKAFWRIFCAFCRAMRIMEVDTGEIENCRVFLRAILTGLKVVFYAFKSVSASPHVPGIPASSSTLFSIRGISQGEAIWFIRLFGDLISTLGFILGHKLREKKSSVNASNPASISLLSPEMGAFFNSQLTYEEESVAFVGDEKEMIENIVQLFILLEAPLFADVIASNCSRLYLAIIKQPALIVLLQTLLVGHGGPEVSKITLSHLLRWLVRSIFGRCGELSNFNIISAAHLQRFIKAALVALNTYPEELESIWAPYLSEIILSSLRVSSSRSTAEPVHSLVILRTLFRAIGGGRFELLYKEILPILPTILETLNGLLLAVEGLSLQKADLTSTLLRDLVVELALTIPVRLSVLLPYLSLLMKPLVFSLKSNTTINSTNQGFASPPDLLSQGLRTLELCIDNLTQDFLDPILSTVMSELLEALWSHCRPLPYPSQFSHTALRIIGKLSGRNRGYSGELVVSETPLTQVTSLEDTFEQRLQEIWKEKIVSPHVISITGSYLESLGSFDTPSLFGLKLRLFMFKTNEEAQIRLNIISRLRGYLVDGIYAPLEEFLSSENHMQRTFFISILLETENEDISKNLLSLVIFLLHRQHSLYAKLSACDIIIALAKNKMDVPLDVIIEALFMALSISQQQATILVCSLQLALERALEALWSHILTPNETILRLLIKELASPFDRNRSMVQLFLETLGDRQSRDSVDLMNLTPIPSQSIPGTSPSAQGRAISQLLVPFRTSLIETEWLSSEKRRNLASLPVAHQVGIIEAVAFILKHDASFFEFSPALLSLISDCTSLADMEDPSASTPSTTVSTPTQTTSSASITAQSSATPNALVNITTTTTAKPPPSNSAVKLRVACIRLLTGAMGSSAFLSNPIHLPLRNRIVSIFFKSLYARSIEVVSAAKRGLALVIAMQHKLPKELMQHGLRPVLMNLSDYKRLTVPGLEGLGRLLELLTSYFKAEIGRKLLEHLKQWADLITTPPITAPEQTMEVSIIVAILDVFHLLPPTSFVFLSETLKTLCNLEHLIKRTEASPFRKPVLKYLARHPSETIESVMKETDENAISVFCQLILTMKEEGRAIVTSPDVWGVLSRYCFSAETTEEPFPVYKIEVIAAMLTAVSSQLCSAEGLSKVVSSFLLQFLSSELKWTQLLEFGEIFSLTLKEVVWNAAIAILNITNQEEDYFQPLLFALIIKLGSLISTQSLEGLVPLMKNVDTLCHILSYDTEETSWPAKQVIATAWVESLQPSNAEVMPQPPRRGPKAKRLLNPFPLALLTTLESISHPISSSFLLALARVSIRFESEVLKKFVFERLQANSSWCLETAAAWILITPSLDEEKVRYKEALRHLLQGDKQALIIETLRLAISSDDTMVGRLLSYLVEASEAIIIQNLPQQHALFWIALVGVNRDNKKEFDDNELSLDLMRLINGALVLPSWWWSITLDSIGTLLASSSSSALSIDELKMAQIVIIRCIIALMTVHSSSGIVYSGKKRTRTSSSVPNSPPVLNFPPGPIEGAAEMLVKTILQAASEDIYTYINLLVQMLRMGSRELMPWHLVDQVFTSTSMDENVAGVPRALRSALNVLDLLEALIKHENLFSMEVVLNSHCPSLFPRFFFLGYSMLLPANASPMLQAAVSLNISSKLATLILPIASNLVVNDLLIAKEPPATLSQLIPVLVFLQTSSLEDPLLSSSSLVAILSDLARDVLVHPPPAVSPSDLSLGLLLLGIKNENSDPLAVIRGASILLVFDAINENLRRVQKTWQTVDSNPLSVEEKSALITTLTFIANNSLLYPLAVAVKMLEYIGLWLELPFLLLKEKMDLIFITASCYEKLRDADNIPLICSSALPSCSMKGVRWAMVRLLEIVYAGPFRHSEVTFQLQKDFLVLLTDCRKDQDLYNNLLAIICNSITPRSLLTHLRYVLGVQNWEPISSSYWIHEALAIVLQAPNIPNLSRWGADAMIAFARIDQKWAQQLWKHWFVFALLKCTEEELELIGKDLGYILSRPFHHAFTDHSSSPAHCLLEGIARLKHVAPQVLKALNLRPALLRYGAKNFGWFGALMALEGGKDQHKEHWLGIADIADAMGESDMAFGARRQMASFPQTILAGSLEQSNYLESAQAVLEGLQSAVRSGRLATQSLVDNESLDVDVSGQDQDKDNDLENDEMLLWQQRWIIAARRLQQWDVLVELARVDNDIDLSLDASWRLLDWSTPKDQAAVRAALELVGDAPTPKRLIYGALLGLHSLTTANPHRRLGDLSRIIEEGFQVTLAQWALLPPPPLGGMIRDNLTLAFQLLVEIQEAIPLFLAAAPGAPPFPTTMVPELRGILGTWRERLPHPDALTMWSDLAAWRQSAFGAINSLFAGTIGDANNTNDGAGSTQGVGGGSMLYRGYHESAWLINRFATVARRQALPDICVQLLNKIYTLPNIEIQDAFWKLSEQANCYLDAARNPLAAPWLSASIPLHTNDTKIVEGECATTKQALLVAGLEIINSTNLAYFSASQKADFFSLKGRFLEELHLYNEEANKVHSQAVQLDINHSRAWTAWGDYNRRRFARELETTTFSESASIAPDVSVPNVEDENGPTAFAMHAIHCYLQALMLVASPTTSASASRPVGREGGSDQSSSVTSTAVSDEEEYGDGNKGGGESLRARLLVSKILALVRWDPTSLSKTLDPYLSELILAPFLPHLEEIVQGLYGPEPLVARFKSILQRIGRLFPHFLFYLLNANVEMEGEEGLNCELLQTLRNSHPLEIETMAQFVASLREKNLNWFHNFPLAQLGDLELPGQRLITTGAIAGGSEGASLLVKRKNEQLKIVGFNTAYSPDMLTLQLSDGSTRMLTIESNLGEVNQSCCSDDTKYPTIDGTRTARLLWMLGGVVARGRMVRQRATSLLGWNVFLLPFTASEMLKSGSVMVVSSTQGMNTSTLSSIIETEDGRNSAIGPMDDKRKRLESFETFLCARLSSAQSFWLFKKSFALQWASLLAAWSVLGCIHQRSLDSIVVTSLERGRICWRGAAYFESVKSNPEEDVLRVPLLFRIGPGLQLYFGSAFVDGIIIPGIYAIADALQMRADDVSLLFDLVSHVAPSSSTLKNGFLSENAQGALGRIQILACEKEKQVIVRHVSDYVNSISNALETSPTAYEEKRPLDQLPASLYAPIIELTSFAALASERPDVAEAWSAWF